MALVILIIALIVEIGLSAYCITTKSNQKKVKNIVRIAELAVMVLFTVLPVIDWSFQWKGLMLLLTVKAIIAGISLLRRKEEKPFSGAKVIGRSVGSFFLITGMLIPAFIFPQYKMPAITGEYKVATMTATYVDENRVETFTDTGENREVNVEFWYPDLTKTKKENGTDVENEKFPLVVFSHGAFGVKASNTSAYMDLASNGYVVCSIDHPYHAMGTVDEQGKLTLISQEFLNEVFNCNGGTYSDEEAYQIEQKWMSVRVPDMELVLDKILEKAEDPAAETVYHMVDPEHIGLMGHSMGGATAAQVARERDDIDAVMVLEGSMLGEYIDFKDGEAVINPEPYPVPILQVYTDNMKNLLAEYPDEVFVNDVVSATAPASYEVYIKGTNHMSLTDLTLFSPFLVSMIESAEPKINSDTPADPHYVLDTLNACALDFFNCYLKGQGEFTMAGEY